MKKFIFVFLISMLLFATLLPISYAHCPLCTAAVGAAAISAKYYGLDISVIGLLIGAFAISTGLWIGLKVKKYFRFQLAAIVIASFLLTVIPLLYISDETIYMPLLLFGQVGSFLNKVYWVNRLLFGSLLGGIVTLTAFFFHTYIKKMHGKVLFPFQGIVLTLLFLVISGFGLYFAIGA